MKRTVYVMTLLAWPSFLHAQPTAPTPEETPTNEATAPAYQPVQLKTGDIAPYDGVLLAVDHAIKLGQNVAACQQTAAAEVVKVTRLMQVEVNVAERRLQVAEQSCDSREMLMQRHLDAREHWYHQPVFVAGATAILTVAAVLAARYTVIERQR